jgi:hypothetical protein
MMNIPVRSAESTVIGFLPSLLTKRPPERLPIMKKDADPMVIIDTRVVDSRNLCLKKDAP